MNERERAQTNEMQHKLNVQMESSSSPIDRVARNYDSLYGTALILIVASFYDEKIDFIALLHHRYA